MYKEHIRRIIYLLFTYKVLVDYILYMQSPIIIVISIKYSSIGELMLYVSGMYALFRNYIVFNCHALSTYFPPNLKLSFCSTCMNLFSCYLCNSCALITMDFHSYEHTFFFFLVADLHKHTKAMICLLFLAPGRLLAPPPPPSCLFPNSPPETRKRNTEKHYFRMCLQFGAPTNKKRHNCLYVSEHSVFRII